MDSTLTPVDRPPSSEAWGPGITMAVLVHVVLIVALAFGVSWRSSEPAGIEAELLAAVPQAAAPKVEAPPKVEQPPPQPKPEPPPPPKAVEPPKPSEAEIALEKARQERLKQEQEEQRREREREAEELKKKQAAEREAQRKREEEEKEKRLAKERELEEQRLAKQRAAEEARLARQREENLRQMLAQAGGTGGTGSAARSAGPSAGYAGRIVARVKPNIVFGDEVAGNPAALVEVRAAADGTITSRRLVRSSGIKAWDDAVLRAIDRTETLPKDIDGRVPPTIEIEFRPNA
jgi:colicin import membrane protein